MANGESVAAHSRRCVLTSAFEKDWALQPRKRATFGAEELAVVLSHYDLGIIESVTDFPRGSSRSPKAGIVCEKGKFLIKRRAADKTRAGRVLFAHAVQKHLADNGFPEGKALNRRVEVAIMANDDLKDAAERKAGLSN